MDTTEASAATKAATETTAKAAPEACGCHMKQTPRSPELKRNVTRRINRAIGQLNGIKQMIDDDRYCGDVLTQLAAVESAVKAVSRVVMRDHLETCVVEQIQRGNLEVVDEALELIARFQR